MRVRPRCRFFLLTPRLANAVALAVHAMFLWARETRRPPFWPSSRRRRGFGSDERQHHLRLVPSTQRSNRLNRTIKHISASEAVLARFVGQDSGAVNIANPRSYAELSIVTQSSPVSRWREDADARPHRQLQLPAQRSPPYHLKALFQAALPHISCYCSHRVTWRSGRTL